MQVDGLVGVVVAEQEIGLAIAIPVGDDQARRQPASGQQLVRRRTEGSVLVQADRIGSREEPLHDVQVAVMVEIDHGQAVGGARGRLHPTRVGLEKSAAPPENDFAGTAVRRADDVQIPVLIEVAQRQRL